MGSMEYFPSPPDQGLLSVCEEGGIFTECCSEEAERFETSNQELKQYPSISRAQLAGLQHSLSRDELRAVFLPSPKGTLNQIFDLWYSMLVAQARMRDGSLGILKKLLERSPFGQKITSGCRKMFQTFADVTSKLLSGGSSPYDFTEVLDWESNWIRALSWHSSGRRLAVCQRNDYVRVYSLGAESGSAPITLRHSLQHRVVALAWRPSSYGALAVACEKHILIWWLDPSSLATRPSPSSAQLFSPPSHCYPVTQLKWNASGTALISGSLSSSDILVWNVVSGTFTPISTGSGGITRISLSPDGSKILSADTAQSISVWNSGLDKNETWTNLEGKCTTAAWSSDGSSVVFSTTESYLLFAIEFHEYGYKKIGSDKQNLKSFLQSTIGTHSRSVYGSNSAYPVFDCSPVTIKSKSGHATTVGGRIHQIVTSHDGKRLAVAFRDNPELIAVFSVCWKPKIQLVPCGLIRGMRQNHAECISFQPGFTKGSLLTVVWSSGKVQFIPLYYLNLGNESADGIHHGRNIFSLSKDSFYNEYSDLRPELYSVNGIGH